MADKQENIIKTTCKELGLTYRELAEKIGVKESTLNKVASTGEISDLMKKAIALYLETLNLKKELEEYQQFKQFIKKMK